MEKPTFRAYVLTRSPRALLLASLLVLLLMGLTVTGMILVPWRQTVIAHGQVAVFEPMHRPQPVDAQLKGRLVELAVREGQDVKKGQLMAVLEDRDSKFLDPEQQQRWRDQIDALREKEQATRGQIEALRGQSEALSEATAAALPAAEAKTRQASQKLLVLRQQLRVGEQDVLTAKLQKERMETLFAEGLRSKRDPSWLCLASPQPRKPPPRALMSGTLSRSRFWLEKRGKSSSGFCPAGSPKSDEASSTAFVPWPELTRGSAGRSCPANPSLPTNRPDRDVP